MRHETLQARVNSVDEMVGEEIQWVKAVCDRASLRKDVRGGAFVGWNQVGAFSEQNRLRILSTVVPNLEITIVI